MNLTLTFTLLAALTLAGTGAVVFSRDALRLVLGLGAFLLGVAGFYLYYGMGFLAVSQVFVYVGGVLVLVLFALMLLGRDQGGRLLAPARFDIGSATVAVALFGLLVSTLAGVVPAGPVDGGGLTPEALGAVLLGPMLPAFELLGVLLLVGLVATLVIVGGGERR